MPDVRAETLFVPYEGFKCFQTTTSLKVLSMAIGVVEFSREGYEIRKDFA